MKKRVRKKIEVRARQHSKGTSMQEAWDNFIEAVAKDPEWSKQAYCLFVGMVPGLSGSVVIHNADETLKLISTNKISIR